MKIAIVSVFKNESHILQEWIQHYINEGITTIFLTDNGSTDTYDIQSFIDSGHVVLRYDAKPHSQEEHLNYFVQELKKYDWVLINDLDEFVYARKGFLTIKDYLKTVPDTIDTIGIPYKMFGSSGFIEQPDSVVQHFVYREFTSSESNVMKWTSRKCIVRGPVIQRIELHYVIKNYSYDTRETTPSEDTHICEKIKVAPVNEYILENSYLHLNHYRIQSLHFFTQVKMTRGDARLEYYENRRTIDFFKKFDNNDILDEELKLKVYQII
jgi:hypothetical protein